MSPHPKATSVAFRQGEIAAEAPVSFAIQTENAGSHPILDLSCANASDVKKTLTLHPGDRTEPRNWTLPVRVPFLVRHSRIGRLFRLSAQCDVNRR